MNAGETITALRIIVAETCGVCGVLFGLEASYQRNRREDGKTFRCPNGHEIGYGRTEADNLRVLLDNQKKATAAAWGAYQEQSKYREVAQRQAAAARGQVTRIKRKVARGECPCCRKSFADLTTHMNSTHPDWNADA